MTYACAEPRREQHPNTIIHLQFAHLNVSGPSVDFAADTHVGSQNLLATNVTYQDNQFASNPVANNTIDRHFHNGLSSNLNNSSTLIILENWPLKFAVIAGTHLDPRAAVFFTGRQGNRFCEPLRITRNARAEE